MFYSWLLNPNEVLWKVFFKVLNNIEQRRKSAFACKGIITDLIDNIENKGLSNDEILKNLT